MRKVIAAMNMTLDDFCDHTAMLADDELHQHYNDLLKAAGVILYGRITYELMEYWRGVLENPTGIKSEDDFAFTMDRIPKIVFSNTLKELHWKTAKLAKQNLKDEVLELRKQEGKDILVGSPGLIVALANVHLIDDFQICVHPVMLGNGSTHFLSKIKSRIDLKLIETKVFGSGAIVLYYQPVNN